MIKMKDVKAAADTLKIAQVSAATDKFLELVTEQQVIFNMQTKYRRPLKMGPLVDKRNKYAEEIGLVKKKDLKAPPHHLQTIIDAFGIFGAGLLNNDEEGRAYYKEMYDMVPFPANKILKLDQANDNAWVHAVLALCKAHFEFCLANLKEVTDWKGTAECPIAEELAKGMPAGGQQQAPAAKVEEVKAAPAKPAPKAAPKKKEPV